MEVGILEITTRKCSERKKNGPFCFSRGWNKMTKKKKGTLKQWLESASLPKPALSAQLQLQN